MHNIKIDDSNIIIQSSNSTISMLVFDEKTSTWKTAEPIKKLPTGHLYYHYRISRSGSLILREQVLSGFKNSFLSAVDLFGFGGAKIASVYRIRNTQYDAECSMSVVRQQLTEFLYSEVNIERQLKPILSELYSNQNDQQDIMTGSMISSFIITHQKPVKS